MAERDDPATAAPDACAVAHGNEPVAETGRSLVVVFASPVADHLLHFGGDLGYRAVLVEPDDERAAAAVPAKRVASVAEAGLDEDTDVVVADHHRPELGELLRDVLAHRVRWVGLMGNARHRGPHEDALAALGVGAEDIARVHRPIGLNIGSRTPPEIAVATLAGLLADRNARPGGFAF
jgi:xanthine dehydrogenase accessory factor